MTALTPIASRLPLCYNPPMSKTKSPNPVPKLPKKPKKPIAPKEPQKENEFSVEVFNPYGNWSGSFSQILEEANKNIKQLSWIENPPILRFEDLEISYKDSGQGDWDYDYGKLEITTKVKKINQNYERELRQYEKKLEKYKGKLETYNEEIKVFTEKNKIYNAELKKYNETLEKERLVKMRKEIKKLEEKYEDI